MSRHSSPLPHDVEPPEGHDHLIYKTNCPKCQADWPEAQGFAVYADGHGHCFIPGCNYHAPVGTFVEGPDGWASGGAGVGRKDKPKVTTPEDFLKAEDRTDAYTDITDRKIKSETMRKFGYFKTHYGKERKGAHAWTLYGQDGAASCQRLRLPPKEFVKIGSGNPNTAQLFGQHAWGEKNDKRVVITEGEFDAMSVAQATKFKFPVVSINGGADSAKKGLQANWKWLDRFEEIILWFDNDEPGRTAVAECAPLFSHGKVKVVTTTTEKDASEILQDNRPGDIELAIYSATTWSPVGIVNAADCVEDVLIKEVPSWHYPFPDLQERTKGARRGEVAYWLAGTGIGKTTVLFEIYHHFLFGEGHTETPAKIGWIGLEGIRRDVILGFMSVDARRRLHLDPLSEADMRKVHKKVFGTKRVELFDQETADWRFEAIMGYIRYMAKALDVNIVMVDPLSFLVAQMDVTDERKAIDKACADLAILSKELGIHIDINHHLRRVSGGEGKSHEEGGQTSIAQARGSGGIGNFASAAFGFERNQQAEGEKATLTAIRVLKNRFVGWTGLCGYLQYDLQTGQTYAIPYEDGKALWGDEDKGRDGGTQTFQDMSDDY